MQLFKRAGGQIVDPPVTSSKTTTTIATDYTYYYRGETVQTTVTVVDENNTALNGAAVTLKFKKPNGLELQLTLAQLTAAGQRKLR